MIVPLVELVRDDVVESVHHGDLAVCTADGELVASAGDPSAVVYVRSAAKPFQAWASVELATAAGFALDAHALAIAAASHSGSAAHQVEAARILALAGLDEGALRCPPARPVDLAALLAAPAATALAHNCSGKHAAFLLAHTASGGAPARYLRRDARVQRLAIEHLGEAARTAPQGPGVDGCGAPAWRLPLEGLARAFASLLDRPDPTARRVGDAMRCHPHLVGGPGSADTQLMLADARVVAKRGAEGVLAAGFDGPAGIVGVAVKITDGAERAAAPVVAAVLARLGASVPPATASPLRVASAVEGRLSRLTQ